MDLLLYIISYLVLVLILTIEGNKHKIGAFRVFLISLFLTPIVGLIVIGFSQKKITFHHYVKINNGKPSEKSIRKTLHTSGNDQWVEIKTSELKII